jgi:sterol desaturase/sphingolipid hydroxylase (fatty acid hydroxylase superfamily)
LGVAEVHRWHHKREYEDAQVNFGEFWMIWDHVFGTYRYQKNGVRAGEVGMKESMPITYIAQIKWPFFMRV